MTGRGVTFHDGKPMTSADAVFSLRRAATDPESTAKEVFADIVTGDIKTLDQRTFEVPLARPRGDFVGMVAGLASVVLPKGITDFTKPVGTGAFILQTYEPGKTAVLKANPNYFRGAPLLDELEVVSITDPIARFNALQAGQIDFAKDLSFASARVARTNPELQVILGGPGNAIALGVTMTSSYPHSTILRSARRSGSRRTARRSSAPHCPASVRLATTSSARACRATTPLFRNRPILTHIGTWVISSTLVNTQGWKRPAFDAQFNEARATADPAKRQEILDDLQRQLYEEGGDVVWGYVQGPDGARKGVRDVQYAETAPLFEKASLG